VFKTAAFRLKSEKEWILLISTKRIVMYLHITGYKIISLILESNWDLVDGNDVDWPSSLGVTGNPGQEEGL